MEELGSLCKINKCKAWESQRCSTQQLVAVDELGEGIVYLGHISTPL